MRKWGHLSSYHVYTRSYSHSNVKNGSVFVCVADDSKKSVTVWAKVLKASEISYLAPSENAMDHEYYGSGSIYASRFSTLSNIIDLSK